jgi:hypothetical protein
MKKLLALAALMLLATFGWAQETLKEKQVPAEIVTDFKLRFHEAVEVTWFKQGEKHYAVRFLVREAKGECIYDAADGQWLQSEQEIAFRELPDTAQSYLRTTYADYKDKQITKVTTRRYGVLYDIHIANGVKQFLLTFDMDGDLLKTKEEVLREATPEEKAAEGEKKKGIQLPKLGGN